MYSTNKNCPTLTDQQMFWMRVIEFCHDKRGILDVHNKMQKVHDRFNGLSEEDTHNWVGNYLYAYFDITDSCPVTLSQAVKFALDHATDLD